MKIFVAVARGTGEFYPYSTTNKKNNRNPLKTRSPLLLDSPIDEGMEPPVREAPEKPSTKVSSSSATATSSSSPSSSSGSASAAPTSWEPLGLSSWIVNTCKQMGLAKPTPIQDNCIKPILKGQDVIGASPTGSGKTAAFALPILDKLSEDPYGVFAVVLTPTRYVVFAR